VDAHTRQGSCGYRTVSDGPFMDDCEEVREFVAYVLATAGFVVRTHRSDV